MAGLSALLLGICSIDNDGSVKDYSRYKRRRECVIRRRRLGDGGRGGGRGESV